ncbi:MAG: HAD family hydrolase [Deltaproteobacteria bacterium RBG_16_48_10]|nr:MAG: HAD family hydrolase [Deltaproteobacteria bacterium RBG_16_48_10]
MFKGFIFDLDGTIYLSDRLIPGAERIMRLLRKNGKKVVFVSNKSLQTREDYASKLTHLGVPTRVEEVVNSTLVMINYLKKNAPHAKLFVVGEMPFIEELKRAGFKMTEEPQEIEYVVVAFDRTFDYRKLNISFQAIKRGAHFVATNPDRTCPVEEGETPDCAGMIAAIEAVTQKKVEVIAGKPSPLIIQTALEVMGLLPEDCIVIGDRLETDIQMGKNSGIATGLVLTGVTDERTLKESSIQPDFVLQSIADVEHLLIEK